MAITASKAMEILPTECKGEGLGTWQYLLSIALLRSTQDQRSALQPEVALDWHKLMIPRRIMRPFSIIGITVWTRVSWAY